MYQPFSAQFFSSIPMAQKFNQCNFSTRNSRSWDITAKHTLERIQTNATSATILQSHNPTHAHPQWRETTQVHRMQKVIQPSSKSEHSYGHSHCAQWKKSFTQTGKLKEHIFIDSGEKPHSWTTECKKSFSVAGTLGRHLLKHTGEKPHPCADYQK